ncbi:hypothetical protein AB1Y20_001949 [Prymnesium parvum]|uniref:Gfo/Idh/MocA-like oxidoreductase N-terminal domain-containing protein n=1 Tax=Prymnesium parvum TaxID=97485 RepID=A0AB34J6K9_PRYPA
MPRVGVVGAGWWAQGWHLPHLSRHPEVTIAAIIEPSRNIRSTLNPQIEQLPALGEKYAAPTFDSLGAALEAGVEMDGVVIAASHSAHAELGRLALSAGLHVFMEKPMTTDVAEAAALVSAVRQSGKLLMVNNTANWRAHTMHAFEWVRQRRIGAVRHVSCAMGSPLLWLFEDGANEGWVKPSGSMLGNGMGWGQLSHTLAWVLKVTGLQPATVYAEMNYSSTTGADLFDAAIIRCACGALINVQGVGATAGDTPPTQTDQRPSGKQIDNRIFGTEGFIQYSGLDHRSDSGALLLRRHDGCNETIEGFEFEDGDQNGTGPASLRAFIAGCAGESVWNGCDAELGFQVVATIEAMYRSVAEGRRVDVQLYDSDGQAPAAKRPKA